MVRPLIEYGPTGQTLAECQGWCAAHSLVSCNIRAAILANNQIRCGFDAALTRCAVFFAWDLSEYLVSSAPATQYASSSECETQVVTPCEEKKPEELCLENGVDYEAAVALCAGLLTDLRIECLFDYCVTGNKLWVNESKINQQRDNDIVKNRPPRSPPAPPSPPPPYVTPPPRAQAAQQESW